MGDGEEFALRPVLREPQMYRYESLIDGTLTLYDILICNEALDVMDENVRRLSPPNG